MLPHRSTRATSDVGPHGSHPQSGVVTDGVSHGVVPVRLRAILNDERHEVDGVGGRVNDRGAQDAQLLPNLGARGLQVNTPDGRALQEADRPQRATIVCRAGTNMFSATAPALGKFCHPGWTNITAGHALSEQRLHSLTAGWLHVRVVDGQCHSSARGYQHRMTFCLR